MSVLAGETTCQKPPKEVLDVPNASLTPTISVSPHRDYAILMQPTRYPSINEVAQPMPRLAGIRIDSDTNGMHLAGNLTSLTIKRLSDGADVKVALPSDAKLSPPSWSPDGSRFAFSNTTAHGIELWLGVTATGQTHRVDNVTLNGVRVSGGGGGRGAGGGGAVEWPGDSRTLLVHLIPAGRGAAPSEAAIVKGPHTQERLGHAGPAPTFEDLLSNTHDEYLFDHYATAQLAIPTWHPAGFRRSASPASSPWSGHRLTRNT
jgi:dipeptidyl aminopeptidase/acylaminoacyl peptidase